jgi:NADPH-dependent 2,4-dienoyl-CoA reductase/sulfur reductase-like enzyme
VSEVLAAETLVVGAGPAGIAAACRLAEAGMDVLLVDEGLRPGGQIWRYRQGSVPPAAAIPWLRRLEKTSVRALSGTSIIDVQPAGTLIGETRDGAVALRGERVILATGARERFLPFPGWTLPGVIGVGAAQALVKAGAEVRGAEVLLAGSGPLLLPVASLLQRSGARVALIAEQASPAAMVRFTAGLWRMPKKIREALRYRAATLRTSYRFGVWVVAAHGDGRVQKVELTNGRRTWTTRCDLLCCSYGLVPNTELARLLGCAIQNESVMVDRFQRTDQDTIYCVGESTGIGGVELSLAEGQVAAAHILDRSAEVKPLLAARDRLAEFSARLATTFAPRAELRARVRPETVVCRCEDVPWSDLDPAWTLRQAKLYTRLGMGPCQARVCGPAMRYLCGWRSDTIRPPLKPCRVATLGGQSSLVEP